MPFAEIDILSSPFNHKSQRIVSPERQEKDRSGRFFLEKDLEGSLSPAVEEEATEEDFYCLDLYTRRILDVVLLNRPSPVEKGRLLQYESMMKDLPIFTKIMIDPTKVYDGIDFSTVIRLQIFHIYGMTCHGGGLDIFGESLKVIQKKGATSAAYRSQALDVGLDVLMTVLWESGTRHHKKILVDYATQVFIAHYEMSGRPQLVNSLFNPSIYADIDPRALTDEEKWHMMALKSQRDKIFAVLNNGEDLREYFPYTVFFETVRNYLADILSSISVSRMSFGEGGESSRRTSTASHLPGSTQKLASSFKRSHHYSLESDDESTRHHNTILSDDEIRPLPLATDRYSREDGFVLNDQMEEDEIPLQRNRKPVKHARVGQRGQHGRDWVEELERYDLTDEEAQFSLSHARKLGVNEARVMVQKESALRQKSPRVGSQLKGAQKIEKTSIRSGKAKAAPKFRERIRSIRKVHRTTDEINEASPPPDIDHGSPSPRMEEGEGGFSKRATRQNNMDDEYDDDDLVIIPPEIHVEAVEISRRLALQGLERKKYEQTLQRVHAKAAEMMVGSDAEDVQDAADGQEVSGSGKKLLPSRKPLTYEQLEEKVKAKAKAGGKSPTKKGVMPRERRRWTADEVQALEEGMVKHGTSWALIAQDFGERMKDRSQVDMKDKARNERIRRERANMALGVWAVTKQ
ncbi:hypothetical protein HDU67_003140 [Dinochytrium kinnereticum]|nr:hypothetical protein HDU67_003140 [Dinochytrium kinnereticum]